MSENQAPKESKLKRISEIEVSAEPERVSTGIGGLDTCLAESEDSPTGLPVGTSILLSGMPGGGKSTIATYIAAAKTKREALYLHGEERADRVKRRWDRLNLNISETDPYLHPLKAGEEALEVVRDISAGPRGLGVVVIDSVQTVSWDNSRKYDAQFEAMEALCGQICSAGGIAILVSHVSKTGKDHAGAAALGHLVDIHIHVNSNSKKMIRELEVRKNRMGRAGFAVPLNVTATGLSVGVPAPLNIGANGGAMARTALEKSCEIAYELLLKGERLDGYDGDKAGVSGGMWRAGLDMATKRLDRDGFVVVESKKNSRKGFQLEMDPKTKMPKVKPGSDAEGILVVDKTATAEEGATVDPLLLEMT